MTDSAILDYRRFLERKLQDTTGTGFAPVVMPDFLYGFQRHLVEWSLRHGKSAVFADCGLGKTPMQLVWGENVVRHTNRPVLVLTPLAVAQQTVREAEKFGIDCVRTAGEVGGARLYVTNYEKLHHFNPANFGGVIGDESSAIKAFDGQRRKAVTEFLRTVPYRLLCTATAAPNDYIELGTSSEALGHLGYMDMLARFFKNDQNTSDTKVRFRSQGNLRPKWRFKGHAASPFWRWVCSWARACRKPSDLGFEDDGFVLPLLTEREHIVKASELAPGMLFSMPAVGLKEEREERRRTLTERCEMAATLVAHDRPAVVWCHLNAEGDALERMIPGSRQVRGGDSDEEKEATYEAFSSGDLRVLITKPKIGAWGLNWQHCAHVVEFGSHSYEQSYQGRRRCWRFGQKNPVIVDLVVSEGEAGARENLRRKSEAADRMFSELVLHMNTATRIDRSATYASETRVPEWL